jgi:hypothetical protein
MIMTTDIALALMAGRAYYDTRADMNRFPVPDGWTEKLHEAKPSGFEAVSFQRGDEIVISYAEWREWGRAKLTAWSDRVTPQDIDEIRP